MPARKVLIIDDETDFRHVLVAVLKREGYDLYDTSTGRDAIDTAMRVQPDLVVTDWMLRDDLHGLHVGKVLLAVEPAMRMILITGHCTDSLREAADNAGVDALLEKPFRFDALCDKVNMLLRIEKRRSRKPVLAVARLDADNRILYANRRARSMFRQTVGGERPDRFDDLYHTHNAPDLNRAMDHWIVTTPRIDTATRWHLRSQEPQDDGSRLVVLRTSSEPQHLHTMLIEMLLGSRSIGHEHWPFDGRILVIDADDAACQSAVLRLEGAGAGAYGVETVDLALRLLRADEGLEFVLIADAQIEPPIAAQVRQIRKARPDITIIGMAGDDRRADLAAGGITRFVRSPWTIDTLVEAAIGRIGRCEECGLPLPLRLARRKEKGRCWSCIGCGRQYTAVLDLEAPPYLHSNTRPAD